MNQLYTFLTICTVLLVACKKDVDEFIPDPTPPIQAVFVDASISGQVTDEQQNPIDDALVEVNTQNGFISTTTDANGIFIFRNVTVPDIHTYVRVYASDYFLGSKTIAVKENKTAYLNIQLLEKTIVGEFNAQSGGNLTTIDNATLNFPANAIKFEDGDAYNGIVLVFCRALNPEANNLMHIMPGNLIGENNQGDRLALATAGMLAIELETPNGEALNIIEGISVQLGFPLPNDPANAYPDAISLWYFDENRGIWILEGEAVKEGNTYLANVTHFSFWNCDASFPMIDGQGKVVDAAGNAVANALVTIQVDGQMLTASGWTNSEGIYRGNWPKNQILTFSVQDACGNPVNTPITLGPFTENVFVDDILINITGPTTNISGQLLDCFGDPVADGYVQFSSNNFSQFVFADEMGVFANTFLYCNQDSLAFYAVDRTTARRSAVFFSPITPIIETGTIEVCDDLAEFIIFELDGVSFIVENPTGGQEFADGAFVNGTTTQQNTFINLFWAGTGFELGIPYEVAPIILTSLGNIMSSSVTLTLSEYGDAGELMIGDFSGTVQDESGQDHTLSGNFKVIRDF